MSISSKAGPRPFRPAFTLIELLMVILITAVLIGLVLTSLQKARETAYQLKCSNNQKQIGLGLNTYHEDYRYFPLSTALKGYLGPAPTIAWNGGASYPYRPGVFAMILPYIGQQDLYQSLRMDLAIDEAPNIVAGQTVVPTYLCPSAKHQYGLTKAPHSLPLTNTALKYGVTDYNGLNGLARLYTNSPAASVTQNHGGFPEDRTLRITDFIDGPANTIHVVESVDFGRGVWIHGRPHFNQSAYAINSLSGYNNAANSVYPDGSNLPVTNRGPGKGNAGTWGISSGHPRGANVLYADGSVHFLGNDTPPQVLQTLGTRDAGD